MEIFEKLKKDGYRYIIIPKKSRIRFWATKDKMKKDNTFKDSTIFKEFRLTTNLEKRAFNEVLPKDVFINITK